MERVSHQHLRRGLRPLLLLSVISSAALISLSAVPAQAASQGTANHATAQAAQRAAAVEAFDGCAATYLCFWVNINEGGAEGKLAGSNPSWAAFAQSQCAGGTWNNCASSIVNAGTSGLGAQEYEYVNYGGGQFCMYDDEYISNLVNFGPWPDGSSTNDSISSNNWETEECGGG
jgi:type II secretory pathway pseudopilin PulG